MTRRITVNLSPADLPKEGGRFDLPMAVGILAADGKIPAQRLQHREFYGELSLGGELRQIPKLLPALIAGAQARSEMIVPAANALEASLLPGAKSAWRMICPKCSTRLSAGQNQAPLHVAGGAFGGGKN
jgi:magnesium chelatase family protein